MSRLTIGASRIVLSCAMLSFPVAAQGPIECGKDTSYMQKTKADFFWRGCLKLTGAREDIQRSLTAANRADLAEEVRLAIRMMGCPI